MISRPFFLLGGTLRAVHSGTPMENGFTWALLSFPDALILPNYINE
jgi:hypothetical protein